MNIKRLSDFRELSPEKMTKLNVFQTERFFLDVYCLSPGQGQKSHVHGDSDKVYVVLDGECRVTVGNESGNCEKGQAILCPAGLVHGVENVGSEPARLLVMMTPPPRK
jgi:quercetin dioxygenase-like cupin family protein